MNRLAIPGFVVSLSVVASQTYAQETPELPTPGPQHEWLQQLVGEWESKGEMIAPDQPTVTTEGAETVRAIGGFWIQAENRGDFMGTPFTGLLTLGYNNEQQQYVGTWIDSVNDYLWTYEGSVDESGKILTLETEGPCHMGPAETARFREVIEIKSPDHKVFTSSMQGEDGSWTTFMRIDYRRVNDE
jgi:hypothetical protein